MSFPTAFKLSDNQFGSQLPERGLLSFNALQTMFCRKNGFTGTLPELGMQSMTSLERLSLAYNEFS
eukprot:6452801-Amphidinium_carterae.1